MRLILINMTVILVCLGSSISFASQKTDQGLCDLSLIGKCTAKCNKSGLDNCSQLCEENIKNECLYAGE